MRYTLSLVALAALAAVPVSAPVSAANAENVRTVRIAYGDVDVTTAEGRAAIEARIDAKLRKACSLDASRYTYGRPVVDSQCVTKARAAALTEVERLASGQTRGGRTVAAN
jgi:UrcA family protein